MLTEFKTFWFNPGQVLVHLGHVLDHLSQNVSMWTIIEVALTVKLSLSIQNFCFHTSLGRGSWNFGQCPKFRRFFLMASISQLVYEDITYWITVLNWLWTRLYLTAVINNLHIISIYPTFPRVITHLGKIQTFYTKYRPNKDPLC